MIRRLFLSLLVGGAVVAIDRPDEAAEAIDAAEEIGSFCATVPLVCERAAKDALGVGGGEPSLPFPSRTDYIGPKDDAKDHP